MLLVGQEKPQDTWEPFRFFIGKCVGSCENKSGESTLQREYLFKFQEKYIFTTNRAVFKPTENNKAGEIHEDFGVLSYDKIRKRHIFRQFHGEGYVNRYTAEISADNRTYTFASESLENMPPGWKTRIVINIEGEDTFREHLN